MLDEHIKIKMYHSIIAAYIDDKMDPIKYANEHSKNWMVVYYLPNRCKPIDAHSFVRQGEHQLYHFKKNHFNFDICEILFQQNNTILCKFPIEHKKIICDKYNVECPICYNKTYDFIVGRCNHMFCLNCCIELYKRKNYVCPMCRLHEFVDCAWFQNYISLDSDVARFEYVWRFC